MILETLWTWLFGENRWCGPTLGSWNSQNRHYALAADCRIWIQPYQWCHKCWINSLHTGMFSVKMVLIVIEAAAWWSPLDKNAVSKRQSKLPKYVFSHMAGTACCDWKSRTSRIDPLVQRDRNLEVPYASQFSSFFLSFSPLWLEFGKNAAQLHHFCG